MTKEQAVRDFVAREFNAIPQDWAQTIMEKTEEYAPLPMWGTMWIVDQWLGERLMKNTRVMVGEADEIDLDSITDETEREEVNTAIEDLKKESIAWGGLAILENYVDEEMAGATCILDANGNTTPLFIYEVEGKCVIGVNGAGFNFYDGVWDVLYDLLGLKWHDEETQAATK